jgi:hypothetical protein
VSPALLQKEARALEALKQARASLLAAMGDGEAQQTRSG